MLVRASQSFIDYPQVLKWSALKGRDSGNDFRISQIASDNSRFLFNLFLYPHVIPSLFTKQLSFLGTDFRFWS